MTSAVITPETKDTPSLTVTVSKLSSSSPFPSPGSPFLPPPVPSAHEYALISPLPKRRSTDSRMNVGSKTDHESAASTHPVTATAVTTTAETTPNPTTEPRPTRDKPRESTDITANGGGNSNGLVAASSSALEPAKPNSKALVNGQATTSTAKPSYSAGVEARLASSEPLPKATPDATLDTLSTLDDDAGGTSASPSTPISSTPSSSAVTTATDDTAKPSLDSLKSARNSLHSSRDSLFSSRPAPLSPADSRRASTALSRHSSSRSRPGSASSLIPSNTFNAETASPTTPTPTQQQQQQQQQQLQLQQAEPTTSTPSALPASSILVKIRDFAFPDEDVRHTGIGPLTPRPNRRLQRPLSTWSASSASSAGSEDNDDRAAAGSSSYGFPGWGLGRLGWFGASALGGPGPAGGASNAPSQGDFARNFTDETSPEYEMDDPYESLDDDDDDDDDDDGGVGAHGENNGERPLLPGLYRALYAFEPEGTAEMALEEDQMVRVIGRGGGVGWAIVARSGAEGHALVPEGYLEFVSLDRDQVGGEEEG